MDFKGFAFNGVQGQSPWPFLLYAYGFEALCGVPASLALGRPMKR